MKFSSPRVLLEDEPYFHLWQKYRVKNAEQTPLTTLYVENMLQEVASKFSLLLPKRVVLHSKSSFSFFGIVSEWKNMFFFFSMLEKYSTTVEVFHCFLSNNNIFSVIWWVVIGEDSVYATLSYKFDNMLFEINSWFLNIWFKYELGRKESMLIQEKETVKWITIKLICRITTKKICWK